MISIVRRFKERPFVTELFEQDEDNYWRSARGFVRILIAILNDALKESGLSKPKRRTACERSAFSICNTLDQCWIRSDGKTDYPLLAFSERFLEVDSLVEQIVPIQLPHKSVEMHAMVCDEISWFFDEQKEILPINSVGSIGEEVPNELISATVDDTIKRPPCSMCKGTGDCYCIRKGSGVATCCPRCDGTGKCRHCHGMGT